MMLTTPNVKKTCGLKWRCNADMTDCMRDPEKSKMLLDYMSAQGLGTGQAAAEFMRSLFEFAMRCAIIPCE